MGRWLETSARQVGELEVQVHTESPQEDRSELVVWLGQELLRNYVNPGELEAIFQDLDAPEVAAYLAHAKFPTDVKVRRGEFGEALTSRMLRDGRWCMPVLKLRYKQRPNQPVQGADAIAFRLRETPPVVAVPEAKTRTTRDYQLEEEANTSLERSIRDLPQTIAFVVARLVSEGKQGLAERVGTLLVSPYDIERTIVIVHEDASWTDTIPERVAAIVGSTTKLTVLRIGDLADLIEDVYAAAMTAPGAHRERDQASGA